MEYKQGLASHTGQESKLLSWVEIVSSAALSLISEDSSVGDVGNDPCVVPKPPGLQPRTISSPGYLVHKKAVPPTGSSCDRAKAGESVHGL